MARDEDYVLGTHDEEIARLGLQHRVWRSRALDAWRRAGLTVGQTIIDVGCGPGYAALDLAEIVGPEGRVVALDRSRRFLDALEAARERRGLNQITAHDMDLDADPLPNVHADGAWCRWVFAFVKRPRDLAARIRDALAPGGVLVVQEYFNYATWQLMPRSPEHDTFVRTVMDSWRAGGGEPDVGLRVPQWLDELGFAIRSLRPIVEVISPSDYMWQWPKAFVESGARRLTELGYLTPDRAEAIIQTISTAERTPAARMITPAVLEIIAIKPKAEGRRLKVEVRPEN